MPAQIKRANVPWGIGAVPRGTCRPSGSKPNSCITVIRGCYRSGRNYCITVIRYGNSAVEAQGLKKEVNNFGSTSEARVVVYGKPSVYVRRRGAEDRCLCHRRAKGPCTVPVCTTVHSCLPKSPCSVKIRIDLPAMTDTSLNSWRPSGAPDTCAGTLRLCTRGTSLATFSSVYTHAEPLTFVIHL